MYSTKYQNLFFLKGSKNNWSPPEGKICQGWRILNPQQKVLSRLFSLRTAITNVMIPLHLKYNLCLSELAFKAVEIATDNQETLLCRTSLFSKFMLFSGRVCSFPVWMPHQLSFMQMFIDAEESSRKKHCWVCWDKLWSDCRMIRYLLWEVSLCTPFLLWLATNSVCTLNKSTFEMRDIFI